MQSPKIAILKIKETIDCNSTARLIGVDPTSTSAVCEATAIVKEKYMKSE